MAKRALQKIDLVPDWLRQTITTEADASMSSVVREAKTFEIVDPYAPDSKEGSLIRKLKAELYADPNGPSVVQLSWDGTTPAELEYEQKFSTSRDAELTYSELKKGLNNVQSYVKVDPTRAKTLGKELLEQYRGKSDPIKSSPSVGTRTNTSLHLEIKKGWDILNKQGRLLVAFTDEFLSDLLSSYKPVSSIPSRSGEMVYTSSSRQHCGLDNFIVSYWRKADTDDGNIIRNAAMISRVGGESYVVSGISTEDYNILCAALTPEPNQYGIAYDSVTGCWYKTAAVVERYFSDPNHPEELDRILDYLGKGKAKKAEPEERPEKKEKAEKEEKKETSEDKKLDELLEGTSPSEESLPLAGEGETVPLGEAAGGSAEKELMDLLKKEAKLNP